MTPIELITIRYPIQDNQWLVPEEAVTRFALEMRRVARGIWVQTPAKEFFFEPHYLTPLLHWLPLRSRRRIARDFSLWGWITRPSKDEVDVRLREIRLLTEIEMARLFPDCRIVRETFLKMRKSYIAVRA